jgi:hypothetical protein
MHIEHIDPNGGDTDDNLCLSCPNCNLSKGTATTVYDMQTGEEVVLFNPRKQIWSEHFEWIDGGLRLQGKSANGRATIERLKINQQRVVRARRNWIVAGNHPPK